MPSTREKIRKKLGELEQSGGKRLKRVAKQLVTGHTLSDERQKERIEERIRKATEEGARG